MFDWRRRESLKNKKGVPVLPFSQAPARSPCNKQTRVRPRGRTASAVLRSLLDSREAAEIDANVLSYQSAACPKRHGAGRIILPVNLCIRRTDHRRGSGDSPKKQDSPPCAQLCRVGVQRQGQGKEAANPHPNPLPERARESDGTGFRLRSSTGQARAPE